MKNLPGLQILCLTDTEDNTQETHTITDTPVSGRHLCRKTRDNTSNDTAGEAYDSAETIHTEYGLFYRGNLRGRAILEADKSIVIVGDIETGATVICKGSVTVTGTIYGTVIAGATGDYNAMIAAIDDEARIVFESVRSGSKTSNRRKLFMGEVIVITSGKGGVGKTTTTANIGAGLSEAWQEGCRDRYRSRPSEPGCSDGTGKSHRIQPGRCDRRLLPSETGADPG